MNELSKFGFVYDLIHRDPNGNEVERRHVHNLIPNEGLKWMLGKIFTPNEIFQLDATYDSLNYLIISLMKGYHTPNKYDTLKATIPFFDEIKHTNYDDMDVVYTGRKSLDRKILTDTTTNTIVFDMTGNYYGYYGYQFSRPTLITGIFVFKQQNGTDNEFNRANALVSEAMLDVPIQMETNGVLDIKCGFTMISL